VTRHPWDAPGISPPGFDFILASQQHSLSPAEVKKLKKDKDIDLRNNRALRRLLDNALRVPGTEVSVEVKPGIYMPATFIPGHIWGQHSEDLKKAALDSDHIVPPVDGPHEADIMVIGKMPWKEELAYQRNFMGPSGETFLTACRNLRFKGLDKWYITNILKFVPPDGTKRLKSNWLQDCLPLLQMEYAIVKPKYILCLGADASKLVMGDPKYGVGYMEGRVEKKYYCVPGEKEPRCAQVMTVVHPAAAISDLALQGQLDRGLARFRHLITHGDLNTSEDDIDHRLCTTLAHAKQIIKEAERSLAKEGSTLVAWDGEWQKQHPTDIGAYLRTIQMSWAEKKAVVFKLRHAGGDVAFVDKHGRPAIKRLCKLLKKFMYKKRACGHFFVNDLEWFVAEGLDLREEFAVPNEPIGKLQPWQQCRKRRGGFDTAMAAHAIEETSFLGLELVAMRYTTAPRWEAKLDDWKAKYCKDNKITPAAMEGYGDCPDEVLIGVLQDDGIHLKDSYGGYDADLTRRIAVAQEKLLDCDHAGLCVWEQFWENMCVLLPILEMQVTGIKVDRERLDEMTKLFMEGRDKKEKEAKDAFNWHEYFVNVKKTKMLKAGPKTTMKRVKKAGFNIRSTDQVKEVLFGTRYNGKFDEDGNHKQIRPKWSISLELEPLIDTSKPPIRWEEVVASGETMIRSPSTNKMVLGILAQDHPKEIADKINIIRHHRFIDQALKQTLRPPELNEDGTYAFDTETGEKVYDKGLPACIDRFGIVRTHLTPTAETGRWKSFRPNMQNQGKNRDDDFKNIFGQRADGTWIYERKLRSLFVARPGMCLIEHDYKGAELFGAGVMSGSEALIEHARRNTLPDGDTPGIPKHPDYLDIHSMIAVLAFKLDCDYSKAGLKSIKAAHLRHIAKSVVFGLFYGRGAKAIAFAVKEQGVNITEDEAQVVIDTVYDLYPELVPFFTECRELAVQERVIFNCFGRARRFPVAMDKRHAGDIERQAMNYPIQALVASALNRGVANLYWALRAVGLEKEVKLLLAIHDSLLIEAPFDLVDYLANPETGLVRWAMSKQVPIYPSNLRGEPMGTGPYYLSMSHEVGVRWSEPFTQKDCERHNIPLWYAAA